MSRHPVTLQKPVARGPGRYESWLSALDALGVQYLFLDTELDSKLLQIVQTNPGWSLDFSDGESVVFARTGAAVESSIMASALVCRYHGTHRSTTKGV